MTLNDFFQPLNLQTLFLYICLFIFLDILGTFIKSLFVKGSRFRILNWLLGLGIFIFVWFLTSLLIPYTQKNVLISIVLFLIVCLPRYLIRKEYKSLFTEIWSLKVPLLIIAPFLPAIFVKASLPPYYGDEMAYHFVSPFQILHLTAIKYTGGIYADLPRTMNMFFEIIFSLTRTYSIARLFHFSILVTSMIFSYKVLSEKFGWFTGFIFVFTFFSLPQDIVLTSTLGYIDVAAYSFLLVAIVSAISFLIKPTNEAFYMILIFWAMNLGTKYTGVSSFASFLLLFGVIVTYRIKDLKRIVNWRNIITGTFLFLVFGGYWYIKNFVYFGNPIFPFIFNCWGNHVEPCPQSGGFFGDWTTKVNLSNAPLILSQLFAKSRWIHLLVLITPLMSIFIKHKRIRFIAWLMFATVALEFVILKYFSGFYVRYHQHMQLYLLLGIVITLTQSMNKIVVKRAALIFSAILLLSSSGLYLYTVRFSNSLRFLNWNEVNYSLGRMNINDWVNFYFPRMKETIRWCEETNGDVVKKLARFDPDLIWFDYDGLMRVFLVNCAYINPPIEGVTLDNVVPLAVANKETFFMASPSKCIPDKDVVKKFSYETDDKYELRKLNNKILCNSKEILPNLYYFDYQSVNANK